MLAVAPLLAKHVPAFTSAPPNTRQLVRHPPLEVDLQVRVAPVDARAGSRFALHQRTSHTSVRRLCFKHGDAVLQLCDLFRLAHNPSFLGLVLSFLVSNPLFLGLILLFLVSNPFFLVSNPLFLGLVLSFLFCELCMQPWSKGSQYRFPRLS